MTFKDWDDIPFGASDCVKDHNEWNDMVEYVRHSACTIFTIYETCPGTGQAFKFTKTNTFSQMYGGDDAGDDLTIYSNSSDTHPRICLFGASDIWLDTADEIKIRQNSVEFMSFDKAGTDAIIESQIVDNDFWLKVSGTGVLKWGTEIVNAGSDRGKLIKMKTEAGDTVYLKTYDAA